MDNNQHSFIQIFLSEYSSFLSIQNEYDLDIHILKDKMAFNLIKIGYTKDIPDKIDCTVTFINNTPKVEINGNICNYSENILETYIKDYIKAQIMIKNEPNKLSTAASMFGLSLNDITNKKLIIERYRTVVRELHPDKWENEDNPVLTKNATTAVIKFTEARDVLLNNINGGVL